MSGYRGVEPAFCRECGTPWMPGAPQCVSCGEALLAPPTRGPLPYAVSRVKRVLIASGVALLVSWLAIGGAFVALEDSPSEFAAMLPWIWSLGVGSTFGLGLVTAAFWLPNRESLRPRVWLSLPKLVDAGATVALCVGVGAVGYWMCDTDFMLLLYGLSPLAAIGDPTGAAVGGALAALLLVELFLRGVVFDGLKPLVGRTNAATAVAIIGAVLYIHPFMMLLGAVSSALRLRSDSIWPGYAVGIAGLAGVALGLA